MDTLYQQIQQHYRFIFPMEYCEMSQRGWFNAHDPNYVWLPEAEWMSLEEIYNHKLAMCSEPLLIPFAFNGTGDLWCWLPNRVNECDVPVVFCPHDQKIGRIYTPNFIGFLFRQVLEYSHGGFDIEEENDARENLLRWNQTFGTFWSGSCRDAVEYLSSRPLQFWERETKFQAKIREHGLLNVPEFQNTLQRAFNFQKLDKEFVWQK